MYNLSAKTVQLHRLQCSILPPQLFNFADSACSTTSTYAGKGAWDDDVYGFFEININGNGYGYYHDKPLRPGEGESELLSRWFTDLIMAYKELCSSGYVAISDIESYIIWIELKRVHDMVEISVIRAEKEDGTLSLRLTPFEEFEYGNWYNAEQDELVQCTQTISLTEFYNELLNKASSYLDELRRINAKLLKSRNIAELVELVSDLRRLDCALSDSS